MLSKEIELRKEARLPRKDVVQFAQIAAARDGSPQFNAEGTPGKDTGHSIKVSNFSGDICRFETTGFARPVISSPSLTIRPASLRRPRLPRSPPTGFQCWCWQLPSPFSAWLRDYSFSPCFDIAIAPPIQSRDRNQRKSTEAIKLSSRGQLFRF